MYFVDDQLSRGLQEASVEARSAGSSGFLTYEPFYGFSEKPFSLSTDPRFLFKSPAHASAFEALLGGIRRRDGLIALTGEIGTGKTTLCRAVLRQLDRRTFAAFVPDPFVSREDLLKILLVDFGVISISDLKRGRLRGASRLDLSYLLYEFLDSLVPLQGFAVLIIDEAQNLSLPLLEEIRILSDLESREKLLQVVLVGQPEFRSNLELAQMRQVNQRVSVRCELTALDADRVAGYVNYRVGVATPGESRVEFTPESLDAIYRGSSGVPRLINRICDRALHRAYSSQSHTIDPKFVWEAIDDLGLRPASATPAASAVITAATEEVRFIPSESEAVAELFVATVASTGHSSRRPWIGVAIALLIAVGAFLGASIWYIRLQAVDNASIAAILPSPPPHRFPGDDVPPRIVGDAPVEGHDFVIQVATFDNPARAERLVEELTSAGYRVRKVELDLGPPRGRLLQVIVGGYSSAIEVERDLQRIRALPGYGDARLLD